MVFTKQISVTFTEEKMPPKNSVAVQKRIGLRIKELRSKTPYSQEALALQSGLDRTYINSVENGRRNISIRAISQISTALKVSLKEFFASDLFKDKE
jgi:transcriptional regulator with XRE-family HTH domain